MPSEKQPETRFSGCFFINIISYMDKCYPFYPVYPNTHDVYIGNTFNQAPTNTGKFKTSGMNA
jgi:hypothetical protein